VRLLNSTQLFVESILKKEKIVKLVRSLNFKYLQHHQCVFTCGCEKFFCGALEWKGAQILEYTPNQKPVGTALSDTTYISDSSKFHNADQKYWLTEYNDDKTTAYNDKSTAYNVSSTAYNVETTASSYSTAYNDKTTAYNAKCTAYNVITTAYNV
jgi:hypothetical protein